MAVSLANRAARIESKKAPQKPQNARNGEKPSRGQVAASDAEIFRIYWVRFGGKRGALTRTAEECSCSLTHVARVLSRHAPKAIPRGAPVQPVRSDAGEIDYVTPRPHVTVPPMDIIVYNRTAADYAAVFNVAFAALYVMLGLLEVWPLLYLLLPFGVVLGQWVRTVR